MLCINDRWRKRQTHHSFSFLGGHLLCWRFRFSPTRIRLQCFLSFCQYFFTYLIFTNNGAVGSVSWLRSVSAFEDHRRPMEPIKAVRGGKLDTAWGDWSGRRHPDSSSANPTGLPAKQLNLENPTQGRPPHATSISTLPWNEVFVKGQQKQKHVMIDIQ